MCLTANQLGGNLVGAKLSLRPAANIAGSSIGQYGIGNIVGFLSSSEADTQLSYGNEWNKVLGGTNRQTRDGVTGFS